MKKSNFILGYKFDASFYYGPAGAKVNVISYAKPNEKQKGKDERIIPEIMLSILFIDVHFGYNIPVGKNRFEEIGKFRFSVSMNVPVVKLN